MQFHVGKLDESMFTVPHGYDGRAHGYERASLIDRGIGSVHMGVGVCRLAAGGNVDTCLHANEKGMYVFEGEIEMQCGGETFLLREDDYALIPTGVAYACRNVGAGFTRWFDMQAPQPKPPGKWQDTFFVDAAAGHCADAVKTGHYEPRAPIVNPNAGVSGLRVFRFMEKAFGAQCFYMMRGELAPGGARSYHDHPVEEGYLALSGEAIMSIEGEDFHLRAGDFAWTGVGASHAFRHVGSDTFRWIETQAPQFPAHQGTRNYNDWEKFKPG